MRGRQSRRPPGPGWGPRGGEKREGERGGLWRSLAFHNRRAMEFGREHFRTKDNDPKEENTQLSLETRVNRRENVGVAGVGVGVGREANADNVLFMCLF